MMMVIRNKAPLERILNKTESAVPLLYDSAFINLLKFMEHKLHELWGTAISNNS